MLVLRNSCNMLLANVSARNSSAELWGGSFRQYFLWSTDIETYISTARGRADSEHNIELLEAL